MPASYPAATYQHVGGLRNRDLTVEKWNRIGDELAAVQATLGVNPHTGYATVAARLNAIESAIANLDGPMIDLRASRSGALTVAISWGLLSIAGYVSKNFSQTCNLGATGVNGLDTGAAANNTWYYLFGIYNPSSNLTATLASLSSSSPTLPSGYTKFRRIGAVRNVTAALIPFNQQNQFIFYDSIDGGTVRVLNGGSATTITAVSASAVVPATSRMAWVMGRIGVGGNTLFLYPGNTVNTGTTNGFIVPQITGPTSGENIVTTWLGTDSSQNIRYRVTGGTSAIIEVWGFMDTI